MSQKLIKKFPSKKDTFSYINYHGLLIEGSPFTYEELQYYDYNLAVQKEGIHMEEKPRVLDVVYDMNDFKNLLGIVLNSFNDSNYYFAFSTKSSELAEQILDDFNNVGDAATYMTSVKPDISGYGISWKVDTISPYNVVTVDLNLSY